MDPPDEGEMQSIQPKKRQQRGPDGWNQNDDGEE
jgi:hypothetical protein